MTPIIQTTVVQMRSAIKDAFIDATASQSRINAKYQEASIVVAEFDEMFRTMDDRASKHRLLNYVGDWFLTPQYDMSVVDEWISKASQKHTDTMYNLQTYRLNSASTSAKEGMGYVAQALVALDAQDSISRESDLAKYAMVIGIPLAVVGSLFTIKRIFGYWRR